LHVLLPLGRQCTFAQARTLGSVLSRVIAEELPDIATVERAVGSRGGRVYVDALQNGHGKLLVAPFSVRPLAGATVSTPLRWCEVNARPDLADYTIRTVPRRLARMGEDPMRKVRDDVPDLAGALARLAEWARG
jgi:bifunctional non-homologous end joining protein LigD